MTSPAKCAGCLLLFFLTGCVFHRTRQVQYIPYAPNIQAPASLQLVSAEVPPPMMVLAASPIYNMRVEVQSIKQPVRRKKAASRNVEEVAIPIEAIPAPIPAISAIGVLSSGDPGDYRRQTEESIGSIERGLNGITRPLNDNDQKIADHIREFLKQAKAALASGDVDGAHTLASKAKVLFDGLNK